MRYELVIFDNDGVLVDSEPISNTVLAGYLTEFRRKLKAGELGSLPVILGLVVICVIFQSLNSAFLSAQNISDITVTMVGTGMISVGIVFVLLLGEIDLSVGSVSGASSAIAAVLAVNQGWPEWAAVLLAVAAFTVFSTALVPGLQEPMAPMVTAPPASPDMDGM